MFFKKLAELFRGQSARDQILVVGAAHIDVLADYRSENQSKTDKIGQVRYSIGGTGYNIAVNLAQSGVPVSLMTVLKENSFSSTWIKERLESAGVALDFVQFSQHLPESGFVGLRSDGVLTTAVTSTAVGEYTFNARLMDRALASARFLVFDCNLAVDQISLLLASANRQQIHTIAAAVSDSKVVRLLRLGDHEPLDLVVLNQLELNAMLQGSADLDAKDVCARLQAKHVVVTTGKDGYTVMSASGLSQHYQPPQVDTLVSSSGAGDALLAGMLTHWYNQQFLDFDGSVPTVANSVRRVLEQPGATRGSLATDIDFARLAKIAIRNEPFWKRFLSAEVGVAAAILTLLLTIPAVYFAYKAAPPSPPPSQSPSPGSSAPTAAPDSPQK